MKILIVEDEAPASKRLAALIKKERPQYEVVGIVDSVESGVSWLESHPQPDLIFMDIQLADGLSFDIFNKTTLTAPVIFTTAYDQYTLKAFKVNSVDYLLKPIDPDELEKALNKFETFFKNQTPPPANIDKVLELLADKDYKTRFLVKTGANLSYLPVIEIAYFYSDQGTVIALNKKGRRFIVDYTLDQLETHLRPQDFFRINRKFIIHISSIKKIAPWFNSRLKLDLSPATETEVIVSRERVQSFKAWLDH
ncbi:MAG: DNA-binding response regulator [Bacteroidetes bacterium]|nr:MAG: DNA-binding response regulator [Bacteroidota bacterium]